MENSALDGRLERFLGSLGDMRLQKFLEDDGTAIGNFEQAQVKANEIDNRSHHFNAKAKNLVVTKTDRQDNIQMVDKGTDTAYLFSHFGLSKVCNTIGVPTDYIKRCLAADKLDLAIDNINKWMEVSIPPEKEMLVRTTDNRLYSLLTNRYGMFDDHEVLGHTNEILAPGGEYKVVNSIVRPEYMKIRIASRELINIGGDKLHFGFDIKNSRLGSGSLELCLLLYRVICGNGCLIGGAQGILYRQRHVGIKPDQFVENFSNMLIEAPYAIESVRRDVENSMTHELTEDKIQQYIDKFKAQSFSTLNMAGQVEQMLDNKYDRTSWGFTNAITEVAQQYSYDVRENMEQFAGKFLSGKR